MATVNIGNVNDAFYRYKMPALQSKIEGRGNGIKTVIVNMAAIAQALERPPEYCTKYFGVELGAISKYSRDIEKAVVNGAHENSTLVTTLNQFIKKFVLCGNCSNPETVLSCHKDDITLSCKACGHKTLVPATERLCTYISKFPPERLAEEAEIAEKARGKKGRRRGKNAGTSAEGRDIDGLDEAADASEVHPTARLQTFVSEAPRSNDELFMEVRNIQDAYSLSSRDMLCLLLEAFLQNSKTPLPELKEHVVPLIKPYLKEVEGQEAGTGQLIVLRYLEKLAGVNDAVLQVSPHICKALYDEDLLDEEAILKWAKKESKKKIGRAVRAKVQPFVDWLENAEEEDSEDDEDDADDDDEEDEE